MPWEYNRYDALAYTHMEGYLIGFEIGVMESISEKGDDTGSKKRLLEVFKTILKEDLEKIDLSQFRGFPMEAQKTQVELHIEKVLNETRDIYREKERFYTA